MSPKKTAVYIMQNEDEEEWVSPTPASTAVIEAVTEATELDETDLQELDSYIGRSTLRELLDETTDIQQTFMIEGYEVTISSSGDITVEE